MKNIFLFSLVGLVGFTLGVTVSGLTIGWHCGEGDFYVQGETRDGRIIELGTPLKRSTKEEEETSE